MCRHRRHPPRQLTVEAGFGISLAVVGWYSSTCKGESFTAPTRVAKRSARNMAQNDTRAPPRPLPHETHLPRSGRVAMRVARWTNTPAGIIKDPDPPPYCIYRVPAPMPRSSHSWYIAGPPCPRVSSPRAATTYVPFARKPLRLVEVV